MSPQPRSSKKVVVPSALNSSHGRDYYFENIHPLNKIKFEGARHTDPYRNGFVPFTQMQQPSRETRVQEHMRKLNIDGDEE